MFYTRSNSFDILLHRGSIVLYVDIFNVRNVIRPANFTVEYRKNAACSLEGVRCAMLNLNDKFKNDFRFCIYTIFDAT